MFAISVISLPRSAICLLHLLINFAKETLPLVCSSLSPTVPRLPCLFGWTHVKLDADKNMLISVAIRPQWTSRFSAGAWYGWWPNYLTIVSKFVRKLANPRARTRHAHRTKMRAAPKAPCTLSRAACVAFLRADLPIGARVLTPCSNNLATNRIFSMFGRDMQRCKDTHLLATCLTEKVK